MAKDHERIRRDQAGVGPDPSYTGELVSLGDLHDFRVAEGEPDVRGWEVCTLAGTEIGEVDDLLVDPRRGEIVMLDVDIKNSDRHAEVPLRAVQLDRSRKLVIVDSGEVDGLFNSWTSLKITSYDKIKSGEWVVLAQIGDEPIPDLPNSNNIPTIPMVAKTTEQRQLLRFGIAAPNQFGKIYVLPPGAPQDRVTALESALTKTFADKEFLGEADKGRLEINPVSAQQAHELITELMGMSPTVKAQLQKMLRAPK